MKIILFKTRFFKKSGNLFDDSLHKEQGKVTNLKSMTISAINEALKSCDVSVLRDDPDNQDLPIEDNGDLTDEGRGMKCHFCIKIFKA